MNEAEICKALANHNTAHISEATKIPPHTLQRIIDGTQLPEPDEIDALVAWLKGEFYLSGIDFQWNRKRPIKADPAPLFAVSSYIDPATLPPLEYPRWADPSAHPDRPILKPGPAPTGNGSLPGNEGVTGTGKVIRA